jgi:4-carboxymuconolactone decarboxylase
MNWRFAAIGAALLIGGCATMASAGGASDFSPRLEEPRLAVADPATLTEAQRDMLGSRANLNIYRTLVHHVDLYNRWSPLGQFILNGSSITPRHREIAMLRMGWLCQSPYEWSQHARIAKASAGMTDEELRRIAQGRDAGWSGADRAVIIMADELRYDAMISDATWAELRKTHSDQQIMELLFTAAQYQLVSMALNTLGIQIEPTAVDFMPADLPKPSIASRPSSLRLTTARIAPIPVASLTPEQRTLVAAQIRPDGSLFNLYGTMANHPKLYTPYEWGHHVEAAKAAGLTDAEIARIARGPDADGWTEGQRAVLKAADELRREAFISDATWNTLARHYDMKERIEIIYTIGGYTMTGLAINSFGIQLEPGYPAMPR